MTSLAALILAAGHGSRMRSAKPKVLHEVGNLPMLGHCLRTARQIGAERVGVIIGAGGELVRSALATLDEGAEVAVQDPPQGTGDAVAAGMPLLEGFEGTVFVLYGDTPLIRPETLERMSAEIQSGALLVVLGFEPAVQGPYGRLITDDSGQLQRIVEAKEATTEELAVRLCNSGVMAIEANALREHLPKITNNNAKQEYYLTDLVGLIGDAGGKLAVVRGEEAEVLGVNNRVELAEAERLFQERKRVHFMEAGVTLRDPSTTYFSHDTEIGQDCVVGQGVVFGPQVVVEEQVDIRPFTHLEGCVLRRGSGAGPFARLRPGTELGAGAHVGNFVETKKAKLGAGVKVGHLTYLGDAQIGAGTNIGAGTITCNYDGYGKHKTVVGENAFIGSNTMLVAPVHIGSGAFTGSGSVITKNVSDGALAVARGKQFEKKGWATSFRKKNGDA